MLKNIKLCCFELIWNVMYVSNIDEWMVGLFVGSR